jgi:hypothetical protein
MIHLLASYRRHRTIKALERTMRPDPDYRTRRLSQFTKERRERYWRNVGEVG